MRSKKVTFVGKFVVVRTENAGVHVGVVVARKGNEIVLRHASRIWQWQGANTLYELANCGADMHEFTRISQRALNFTLVIGVIEVIETTKDAERNLSTPRWL
jgi:hypothetical protein